MKHPIPFGKYYLLERINVGGMAEVFRAKAYGVEGFERLIAVKRILPSIAEDKEFIRMFIDEAKIAVQLNHANIAQIFDLGMVDGSYYIALEHIHGRDLRAIFDRCRGRGDPMPISQACFVVMKICEGLDYAHNKRDSAGDELNLIHRDVSPQNMLVSFEGEVKLIDFGIAKAAGTGSKTQAGILKGKFGYMSPEQVRGLPIDRRSDIFSCGIVLYELLTGERVFVGESDFSTLEKVRNVEILPPSTYNRKIPDELERIVLKALAKDPDDRYQHAIDLHDELQAFVYTAGEFYSRKDLAGWMKQVFSTEIELESAKLDAYRRMKPETQVPPPAGNGRARTKPPPPPKLPNGRPSAKRPAMAAAGAGIGAGLVWDEDELETAIYEGKDDPRVAAAGMVGAVGQQVASSEPDLASLVPNNGAPWDKSAQGQPPLGNLADGSNGGLMAPDPMADMPSAPHEVAVPSNPALRIPPEQGPAVVSPLDVNATGPTPALIPLAKPGHERRRRVALIGGAAAAVLALIVASYALLRPDSTPTASAQAPSPAVAELTGFDLDVLPRSVTGKVSIKIDNKSYATAPPVRVRNLSVGPHTVEVTAPPGSGYYSKHHTITVVAGTAPKITLELDKYEVVGRFTSEPSQAKVTVHSEGKQVHVGPTPVDYKLDPTKNYDVVFEKDGFVTQTKPVLFRGSGIERIAAIMEPEVTELESKRSDTRAAKKAGERRRAEERAKAKKDPRRRMEDRPRTEGHKPVPKIEYGTIGVASKPNGCTIYVDGQSYGITPRRGIRLKAGRRRITLACNEHGIKKSFSVLVKPNQNKVVVKNYMGLLPEPD